MAHSWKEGFGKEYHYPQQQGELFDAEAIQRKHNEDVEKLEKLRQLYEANKHCEAPKTPPSVSAPPHYRFGGNLQTIDLIHEVLSKQQDGFLAYTLGNIFKYLTRFGRKDGLNDLKKAYAYLGWAIEHIETGGITHA